MELAVFLTIFLLVVRQHRAEKNQQIDVEIGRMNLRLGLYFCRLAVELHAGRIWVGETERFPTTFVISLPRLSQIPVPLPVQAGLAA